MVADHACHCNAHYYLQIIQALLFLDQWFPTGGKFPPGGEILVFQAEILVVLEI